MKLEHLSWSKENRFEKCGQQFAYVYGEGLRRPPGVAMIRGIAPHRSAEADLKAKLETGSLLETGEVVAVAEDYIAEAFRGEVTIDGEFEYMSLREVKETVRDDARKMARNHHHFLAPLIEPTGVELRIEADFPDLPIPYEGVIDTVDRGVRVRDVKTKRKAPSKNDAHDSGQLTIYRGLFEALYEKPPEDLAFDVLWVTPGGKDDHRTLVTTRTDDDLRVHLTRSLKMLDAVEAEIFLPAPSDSWQCSERWCGFTDICPYFRGRPRPTS